MDLGEPYAMTLSTLTLRTFSVECLAIPKEISKNLFHVIFLNVNLQTFWTLLALRYHHSARYGQGDGPIWLDEVKCSGNELNVANCTHNPYGETDCEHHEDVSIECHTERIPGWDIFKLNKAQIFDNEHYKVRLAPLRRHRKDALHEFGFITAGYLEFLSEDNRWRRVCNHGWTVLGFNRYLDEITLISPNTISW